MKAHGGETETLLTILQHSKGSYLTRVAERGIAID